MVEPETALVRVGALVLALTEARESTMIEAEGARIPLVDGAPCAMTGTVVGLLAAARFAVRRGRAGATIVGPVAVRAVFAAALVRVAGIVLNSED